MNLAEAFLLITLAIIIVGGFFFVLAVIDENKEQVKNDECLWEPGNCKKLCNNLGVYFDKKTDSCKAWNGGNCCTNPPFSTLNECQRICE